MCQICKGFLASKACLLAKTANAAVHYFDPTTDVTEAADDSDEDSESCLEDTDDEELLDDNMTNTQTVCSLISRINDWRRLDGPWS